MQEQKSLRENWSNWILHLSSFINRKKNDLLIKHGFSGLGIVLTIIGAEILLLLVSLPSYLAASPTSLEAQVKEYKLRRSLTLGTFLTLLIIWTIKLVIILLLVWYSNSEGELQINNLDKNGREQTMIETAAHDMLVAGIQSKLLPPEITKVESTHRSITIWGKTLPFHGVIFVFSEIDEPSLQPKVYTTWADEKGDFTMKENSGVFNLPKGTYRVSAITYDQKTKSKSENEKTFTVEIKGSLFQSIFYSIDTLLNIIALLVIIVGFLLTLLVT